MKISDCQWLFLLIPIGASSILCCLIYFWYACSNNESQSIAERPSGDNFVAEFDEEVPKIDDSKEDQNLPPPNYEIATEQFKATCHYCDKIYNSKESLKMHLISHRMELNQ